MSEVERQLQRRRARLLVVETVLTDPELHRHRLAGRVRDLAIPEPTWETVTLRRDEWVAWPFAPLTVDAVEPLADNLARVVAAVEASRIPADNKTPEGTPSP